MNNLMLNLSRLLAVDMAAISNKVNEIMKIYVGPVLTALGACAVVFMVVQGVQYAKAEDPAKREEIKKKIINALIGMVMIIGLAVLCIFVNWGSVVQIFGYAGDTWWCSQCKTWISKSTNPCSHYTRSLIINALLHI